MSLDFATVVARANAVLPPEPALPEETILLILVDKLTTELAKKPLAAIPGGVQAGPTALPEWQKPAPDSWPAHWPPDQKAAYSSATEVANIGPIPAGVDIENEARLRACYGIRPDGRVAYRANSVATKYAWEAAERLRVAAASTEAWQSQVSEAKYERPETAMLAVLLRQNFPSYSELAAIGKPGPLTIPEFVALLAMRDAGTVPEGDGPGPSGNG